MINRLIPYTYTRAFAGTVDDVLAELLGEKRRRVWFCTRCGTFHAEGLDARFYNHHQTEKIQTVASVDVADYRQLEHKEGAGG